VLLPQAVDFSGPRTETIAARLTDRLMLHATRTRQSKTHAPKKARVAPTAMNTVPSGRDDFCMNGASAVNGMTRVGMPAPWMVGRSVRWNVVPVAMLTVLDPLVDAEVV
jgi:SH3-like domain-containing protein